MRTVVWIVLGLCAAVVAGRSVSGQTPDPVTTPPATATPATTSNAAVKAAPPTPIAEKKAELGDDQTWRMEWDVLVEKALPGTLLSGRVARDVRAFCPRFNRLSETDRRQFWAYFFQALSGAEAGLKATSDVRHTEPEVAVKDGVTHRMVRSEGLLQLTYEDAARYGCDFDWEKDKELPEHDSRKTILQPRNNLLCGVKILESQLIEHRKPLLSKTSYWATLRPGFPGYQVFLKQMTNAPSACGRKTVHRKSAGVKPGTLEASQ